MCVCNPLVRTPFCGAPGCEWPPNILAKVKKDFEVQAEPPFMLPTQLGVKSEEEVNHPQHYGGDTTYEVIKVIEAWGLGFNLGNTVKYIGRAGKKGLPLKDLKKAAWYLAREIKAIEGEAQPGDPTPFLQATGLAKIQRQENLRQSQQIDKRYLEHQ